MNNSTIVGGILPAALSLGFSSKNPDTSMYYNFSFKGKPSTTEFWFRCWLDDYFDGKDGGFWRPQPGTVVIPHLIKPTKAAGLPLPAAAGTANSHTCRHHLPGEPGHELPEILLAMRQAPHADMLEFLSPSPRRLEAPLSGIGKALGKDSPVS